MANAEKCAEKTTMDNIMIVNVIIIVISSMISHMEDVCLSLCWATALCKAIKRASESAIRLDLTLLMHKISRKQWKTPIPMVEKIASQIQPAAVLREKKSKRITFFLLH